AAGTSFVRCWNTSKPGSTPAPSPTSGSTGATSPTRTGCGPTGRGNALPHVNTWDSAAPADFPAGQPAWARSEIRPPNPSPNTLLPAWFKSSSPVGFTHDWLQGDIVVHTTDAANGAGSGPANVTWTSTLDGTVTISGGVWMGRDIDRANHWALSRNGVLLTEGAISSGDPYNRANPFSFGNGSGGSSALVDVPVAVGGVIELRLTATSAFGDFVGVNFTVAATAIPPASLSGVVFSDFNNDGQVDFGE